MGKVYGSIYFVEDLKDETIKDIKDDPCSEFVICLNESYTDEELRNITILNDAKINILIGGKCSDITVNKLESIVKELSDKGSKKNNMMSITNIEDIFNINGKDCDDTASTNIKLCTSIIENAYKGE